MGDITFTTDIWIFDITHEVNYFETYDMVDVYAKMDHEGIITEPVSYTFRQYVIMPDGYSSSAGETGSGGQYNSTTGYTDFHYTITCPSNIMSSPYEDDEYMKFPSGTIIIYCFSFESEHYNWASSYYIIEIP